MENREYGIVIYKARNFDTIKGSEKIHGQRISCFNHRIGRMMEDVK